MTEYRADNRRAAISGRTLQLQLARSCTDARMRTVHRKAARAFKRAALAWS